MIDLKTSASLFIVAFGTWAQSNNAGQPSKPLTPEQIEAVHGRLFRTGPPGQIPERLAHTSGDVNLKTGTMTKLVLKSRLNGD
jgi:hypothetical protein